MRTLICAAGLAALCVAQAHASAGRLVIAGGAVTPDNTDVHQAIIAGLGPAGRVAIIPAASGEPARSAQSFSDALVRHGVPADRIDVVHLAVVDDSATLDIDESRWSGNATSAAEIAKIAGASAIWFTGGDQVRIIAALVEPDGDPSPMLGAIRGRLSAGATVGGTSAGAAVMSAAMIARGDSLAALTGPLLVGDETESTMDGGRLMLGTGLGFFAGGLIDQHFDRKARLGRLTRALAEMPPVARIGFGIDENTALVVDLATNTAVVAGGSTVTLLDARKASIREQRGRFSVRGIDLSVLAPGDRVALDTLDITLGPGRKRIVPAEGYYTHAAQSGAGMALPNAGLEDALGVELLDNRTSTRLERISFQSGGLGVRYVFSEAPESWGAFGGAHYTISRVRFDIEPVRIRVQDHR